MKKYVFLFFVVFATSQVAVAQFNKGDKLLNLGIGLNSYYSGGIPLHASFEVGVTNEVSVGVSVDYLSHRYRSGGVDYGFNSTYVGLRGAFHFTELLDLKTPEFDLYAGAALGFRSFGWRDDSFNGLGGRYGNGVYLGIFVGGRYYFQNNFGVFGELGAGGSGNARLGVSFRF